MQVKLKMPTKKAAALTAAKKNELRFKAYQKDAEASRTKGKLFAEIQCLSQLRLNPFLSKSERAVYKQLLCSTIRKLQVLQNGMVKLTHTIAKSGYSGVFLSTELKKSEQERNRVRV